MNIKGIHHIELTVSDLERSRAFYGKLPGFKVVAEYPDFCMFSCGKSNLGLTTHKAKTPGESFSEFKIGLDHVSFETDANYEEVSLFFKETGIPHGELKKLSNNLSVIAFRDPDNIQLELAWREE